MSRMIDPVFYSLICAATLWLGLLWMGARLHARQAGWRVKLACGAAAALLLFCPVTDDLPLWKWVFSICPNLSLPFLGLISAALWQRLSGATLLTSSDWHAAWNFGAVAGCALYLQPLGFETADLYYWGWHHRLAVWVIAGLAVAFLCWGNRLGVLLAAALVAYELQALDSPNGWDYLVDPFYWLIGSAIVLTRATSAWRERLRRQRRQAAASAVSKAPALETAPSLSAPPERAG